MLTWELLGTVLGAGIVSGREVASFFTRYGLWSLPGILLAGCTLIWLAKTELPASWQKKYPGTMWSILLSALLTVTGGAMLAGAGEVAALVLPLHNAYGIGVAATLVLSWCLAHKTQTGLAWTSRMMLLLLVIVIISGLRLPEGEAIVVSSLTPSAIVRAAAYGGFNAALLIPLLSSSNVTTQQQKGLAIRKSGVIFIILLLAGNSVMLRQPQLLNEPLPFVCIMQGFGKSGYYLAAASLYFAILSTLTACFRGLGRTWYAVPSIFAIAMLGFSGVVEVAYPLIGTASLLMLAAAKFTNCSRKPFQSRRDMI